MHVYQTDEDKKSFHLNTAELEADDGHPEASPQWLPVPFGTGKPLVPLWDAPAIHQSRHNASSPGQN